MSLTYGFIVWCLGKIRIPRKEERRHHPGVLNGANCRFDSALSQGNLLGDISYRDAEGLGNFLYIMNELGMIVRILSSKQLHFIYNVCSRDSHDKSVGEDL